MSALSAAETVLQDAGTPMDYREISRLALERGYWQSAGKTPWATMGAQLYTDIRKHGAASRFVQTAPETFGLNPHPAAAKPPKPAFAPSKSAAKVPKATGKKANKSAGGKVSFVQAAVKVLTDHGKKKPMHYREITEKALNLGLLDTKGKTPEVTMYAQILSEIGRYRARGEQPRFVQHKGGFVSLSVWTGKGLAFDIEQHNKRVRGQILKRLIAMSPTEFEHHVSELLAKIGFDELDVTPPSKDGGIDVRGVLVVGEVIRTKMAVQVKKWGKQNVQAPQVQQVRGSLGAHEQGLIITTSDFSKGARTEATRPDAVPVALMNGEQLVALMVEHEVGCTRRSHDILELEGDDSA